MSYFFVALAIYVFVRFYYNKEKRPHVSEKEVNKRYHTPEACPVYSYPGHQLEFQMHEYRRILTQHHGYFSSLNQDDQEIFLKRLSHFISKKTYVLYGHDLLKEKPILVSASFIQLSFGLQKYLLETFSHIHVYPAEFLRTHPVLCFLQGNVSGNSIRLSWKHFLQGMKNYNDGSNVGLHEMAHALYYQTFVTEKNVDIAFRDFFNDFNDDGNKVYLIEQALEAGLYSRYAMRDFQEFWAESVEIFFEKPLQLQVQYPKLYDAMKTILNQDPVSFNRPVDSV